MEIGSLVFVYYWWHHTVPLFTFTATKDDRSGWQLCQWCSFPVILKDLDAKMLNGKLTKTAIVARPDHPEIEVEVLAELLRTEPIDLQPFPVWQVGIGDTVTLLDGKYEAWYLQIVAKQPYTETDKGYKVYADAVQDWRKKYTPDNVFRIPKFTVLATLNGMAKVSAGAKGLFEIPVDCFAVLEKKNGLAA